MLLMVFLVLVVEIWRLLLVLVLVVEIEYIQYLGVVRMNLVERRI